MTSVIVIESGIVDDNINIIMNTENKSDSYDKAEKFAIKLANETYSKNDFKTFEEVEEYMYNKNDTSIEIKIRNCEIVKT